MTPRLDLENYIYKKNDPMQTRVLKPFTTIILSYLFGFRTTTLHVSRSKISLPPEYTQKQLRKGMLRIEVGPLGQ